MEQVGKKKQDFLSIFQIVCRLGICGTFHSKINGTLNGVWNSRAFLLPSFGMASECRSPLLSHFWNTFWHLTESMTTEQEVCPIHQGLNVKRGGRAREPSNDRKGRRGVDFFLALFISISSWILEESQEIKIAARTHLLHIFKGELHKCGTSKQRKNTRTLSLHGRCYCSTQSWHKTMCKIFLGNFQ